MINRRKILGLLVVLVMMMNMFSSIVTAEVSNAPAAKIGSNLLFMGDWSGETPFKRSIDWANAYKNGDDVWNEVFIKELAPYSYLRFMDWDATNNSVESSWSTRRLPTDPLNNNVGTTCEAGVAYEWQIDLGNRTNKDIWICVPHKADDNYFSELAKLVKDKLKPNLKCYIEYSNETWNSGFIQNSYCKQMGAKLGFEGIDDNFIGQYYSVYRSLQMFKIFETVFGSEMQSRIMKICSISGYLPWFSYAYRSVAYNYKWNPTRQFADMLCIAPYIGISLNGASATIIQDFKKEVDTVYSTRIVEAKQIASDFQLRLGTYEGGQHILTNSNAFSNNPQAYDCYIYMLNKFCPDLEMFTHFGHCGSGDWGAKAYTGQPIEKAHKYRALVDWIADHPVLKTPVLPAVLRAPIIDIKYITDRTTTFSGNYLGNSDLVLTCGAKSYKVISDEYGDYAFRKLDFSKKKDGALTLIAYSKRLGVMEKSPVKVFRLVKLPKDIKLVNAKLTTNSTAIAGSSSGLAMIKLFIKGKEYKRFKADKVGKFYLKIYFKKYTKNTAIKIYSYLTVGNDELRTKILNLKLK